MDYEKLLFYDVEVFKYNSMVVFKDIDGKTVKVFSSSLDGLGDLVDKGIVEYGYDKLENFIKNRELVGYNNYNYDDYILYAMTKKDLNPYIKSWNDTIINGKDKIYMKKIDVCKTYDVFQQIDISKPSLKKIEGNMGLSIIESNIDFDIDRELTPSENYQTFKYCEYDVLNTVKIFKMRNDYYKSKMAVVNMLDESIRDKAYKWNTTSITGALLKPKQKAPSRLLVTDDILQYAPSEVLEMWEEIRKPYNDFNFKKKKVLIESNNITYEFGWGGLHGAPKKPIERWDIKLLDVGSMYPSILINLRGLTDKTKDYKGILDYRLSLKHQGKTEEQAPYKLILNSTYGLLNNKYSQLNNPYLAYSICIYGQVALFVLCERLAQVGAELINVNTDGVAYRINNRDDERIKEEREKEFNLTLELDEFKRWIQKDVNNYIAVKENGKLKLKGGDVNKYSNNKYFSNNDTRITHLALVDKLLYNKSINDTIRENLDKPLLFQYILQAGRTYQGVVEKNKPKELLKTRINRVFASKKGDFEIVKKRVDGGVVKFADAPSKMYLFNDDLKDFKNFRQIVDKQYYADLTMKKLKGWQYVC